ncbi:MAG: zinc-finger domain-containing protein [Rhodospirillales bacterium]
MSAQLTEPSFETETFTVSDATVACDGGGGALGHPTVYLKIGPERQIVCPYCSRTFVLAEGATPASGH